jgi:hypothetical protein
MSIDWSEYLGKFQKDNTKGPFGSLHFGGIESTKWIRLFSLEFEIPRLSKVHI